MEWILIIGATGLAAICCAVFLHLMLSTQSSKGLVCVECGHENPKIAKHCGRCGKLLYTKATAKKPLEAFYIAKSKAAVVMTRDGTLFIATGGLLSWVDRHTGVQLPYEKKILLGNFFRAAMMVGPIRLMVNGEPQERGVTVVIDPEAKSLL